MALTLTNSELRLKIGEYAGYGSTVSSFDSEQSARVSRWLDDGKREFYHNALAHEWSFLSPTIPFTLVEGQWRHPLPADCAMIYGPIHFRAGSGTIHEPIELTNPERIQKQQQVESSSGTPCLAAMRPVAHNEGDFLDGSHSELIVWPTPSEDYAIDLHVNLNPLAPTTSSVLPIGDQFHVQTLVDACLAQVDKFNGDLNGVYITSFPTKLAASVAFDLKKRCPDTLGINRDASDRRYDSYDGSWRDLNVYTVTTSWDPA